MFSRIGIIGDVHAEHEHLAKALSFLEQEGVDTIICTGDLADGRGDIQLCTDLLRDFSVQTVMGNHDRWLLENKVRHIPDAHNRDDLPQEVIDFLSDLPKALHLQTPTGTLMLCHGVGDNDLRKVWPGTTRMPAERSHELDHLLAHREIQMMVNGHVHYRTLIHFNEFTLLNAGTLRGDHHPGFSLLDLGADQVTSFEFKPTPAEVKSQPFFSKPYHQVFENTQHFNGDWEPVTLYA